MTNQIPPVLELRIALTTQEYERLMQFYCDAVGMDPAEQWITDHSHASLFQVGQGSLEIFDEAHAAEVDQIEVGRRISGNVRLALQVPDLQAALNRLASKGIVLVHPPVMTPWGDFNARVTDPDGMQITLFQKKG